MLCIWKYKCKITSDIAGLLKGQQKYYLHTLVTSLATWSKITVYWHLKNECDRNLFSNYPPEFLFYREKLVAYGCHILIYDTTFTWQLCFFFSIYSVDKKIEIYNLRNIRFTIKCTPSRLNYFIVTCGETGHILSNFKIYVENWKHNIGKLLDDSILKII